MTQKGWERGPRRGSRHAITLTSCKKKKEGHGRPKQVNKERITNLEHRKKLANM